MGERRPLTLCCVVGDEAAQKWCRREDNSVGGILALFFSEMLFNGGGLMMIFDYSFFD
jgi:hypothetical protein